MKLKIAIVVFVMQLFLISCHATPEDTIENNNDIRVIDETVIIEISPSYEEGITLFENKKYEEALIVFHDYLENIDVTIDQDDLLMYIASSNYLLGHPLEAIEYFEQVVEKEKYTKDYLSQYLDAYIQSDQETLVYEKAEKFINSDLRNIALPYIISKKINEGQYDEAMLMNGELLAIDVGNFDYLYNEILLLGYQEKYDLALNRLDDLEVNYPDNKCLLELREKYDIFAKDLELFEEYRQLISENYDLNPSYSTTINLKNDLDNDGFDEIIIAFGRILNGFEKSYEEVFLLTTKDGLHVVDKIYPSLPARKLELIQMEGNDYMTLLYTVGNFSVSGFTLIDYMDGEVCTHHMMLSSTGIGSDQLTDLNDDGKMDAVVTYRSDYSYMYYEVKTIEKWIDGSFELFEIDVTLPEYPVKASDVVLQYMELNTLRSDFSFTLNQRLDDICVDEEEFDEVVNQKYEMRSALVFHDDNLTFTENLDDYRGTIQVVIDSDEYDDIYYFDMLKLDDKWRIRNIRKE